MILKIIIEPLTLFTENITRQGDRILAKQGNFPLVFKALSV